MRIAERACGFFFGGVGLDIGGYSLWRNSFHFHAFKEACGKWNSASFSGGIWNGKFME
jgi:hypothetical protein